MEMLYAECWACGSFRCGIQRLSPKTSKTVAIRYQVQEIAIRRPKRVAIRCVAVGDRNPLRFGRRLPIPHRRNKNPPFRGTRNSLERYPTPVRRQVRRCQGIPRVLKQDQVVSRFQIPQEYPGTASLLLFAINHLCCVRRPVVQRAAAVRADLPRRASLGSVDVKTKGRFPIPPKDVVQNL